MSDSERPKDPVSASARSPSVRPKRAEPPRSVVMWVAIAATVVLAGAVAYTVLNRPPAPSTSVPAGLSSPLAVATELRRQAKAACDEGRADECLALLGKASAQDPDGDRAPEVTALRAQAVKAIEAKPK